MRGQGHAKGFLARFHVRIHFSDEIGRIAGTRDSMFLARVQVDQDSNARVIRASHVPSSAS